MRRNAARGVRAVAFSELPGKLGLPTIHADRYWEPFFAACDDTGTVVFMHIGSGSHWITTSPDAPPAVTASLVFMTSAMALTDWLFSGVLARYPDLRVCFAEGQIGWMPYVLERADKLWEKGEVWAGNDGRCPRPPSPYMRQVYGCFYDDAHGLARATSSASTRSRSRPTTRIRTRRGPTRARPSNVRRPADDDELRKVLRDNARELLGLP